LGAKIGGWVVGSCDGLVDVDEKASLMMAVGQNDQTLTHTPQSFHAWGSGRLRLGRVEAGPSGHIYI